MEKNLFVGMFIGAMLIVAVVGITSELKPTFAPEDLNQDGVVDIKDFSVAVYQLGIIMDELGGNPICVETCPPNQLEPVYPPVPLPYQEQ